MSALAPTLQAFFTDRLIRQRHASGHTIAAYRDTMRLLLTFAEHRLGKQPSVLDLSDLFRAALGAGQGESTLAEEVELADCYLCI